MGLVLTTDCVLPPMEFAAQKSRRLPGSNRNELPFVWLCRECRTMEGTGVERRLAAIFAADVEGYSRLMHSDEEATMATLSSRRATVGGGAARIRRAHCR